LRKAFVSEIKAPADDGRIITFAISTEAVDRMGDTIAVDGWKLDNFRANPVVLFGHNSDELPVAKCRRIWVETGKLMAEADFTPTPTAWPEFNESVFQFLKHGLLNATSVGFAPMKYAFSEEDGRMFGVDFLEQELLEFSIVDVPANPECLQQAKSLGLNVEPMIKWCTSALAKQGLVVMPQAQFDAINALPEEFRAAAKKVPASVKGARGLWLRCANLAEKAIKGEVTEALAEGEESVGTPPPEPEAPAAESPSSEQPKGLSVEMARRRLAMLRE
jgi:HK97 family phage prohead protease